MNMRASSMVGVTVFAVAVWCGRAALAQGRIDDKSAMPPSATAPKSDKPKVPDDRETTPRSTLIDLRPKFVAGRTTRFSFDMDSANKLKSQSTPELDQDQTQSQKMWLALKVLKSGTDGSEIELAVERISVSLKTPDGDFSADSAVPATTVPKPGQQSPRTPAKPPQRRQTTQPGTPAQTPGSRQPAQPSQPADPLAGLTDVDMQKVMEEHVRTAATTRMKIVTDPAGNIVSVTGGESLSGGGMSAAGLGGGLVGGMGLNPSALANWVVAGVGRSTPAKVGETWSTSGGLAGTPVGGFTMITKNTLVSASRDMANISFDGLTESSSAGTQPGGFQLRSAKYVGTYQWDTGRGELAGMTANMDTVIDAAVLGQATLTAKQKVRVERLR